MQTCRCLPISTAAYRRTRTPWKPFHLRREAKQKRLCAYSFLNPIDRHSLTILMIIPFRLCAYTSSGRFLLIGVWASRLLYVFCSTSTSNSSPEDTAARESSPFCACAHVTQTNVSQRPPPLTDTCVSSRSAQIQIQHEAGKCAYWAQKAIPTEFAERSAYSELTAVRDTDRSPTSQVGRRTCVEKAVTRVESAVEGERVWRKPSHEWNQLCIRFGFRVAYRGVERQGSQQSKRRLPSSCRNPP